MKLKRQLSVSFHNFWRGFEPETSFFVRALREKFDVRVERIGKDIQFFSGAGRTFPEEVLKSSALKVWFTGEPFTVQEASDMGLVTDIAEDVDLVAARYAEKIAQQPPQALINTKALMKARLHDSVAAVMRAEFEIFAMALQSEEAAEAFMNFMSKRSKS